MPRVAVVGVTTGELMPVEGARDGQITGFGGDLLNGLLAGTRVRLQVREFRDHNTLLAAACAGRIDLILSAIPSPRHEHCLRYSAPYLERSLALVAPRGNAQATQRDFIDRARIVVEAGSAWLEEALAEHAGMTLLQADSVASALDKVSAGQADGYVGLRFVVHRLLEQPRFAGLQSMRLVNTRAAALHFAGPTKSAALIAELDRRLAALPNVSLELLRDRWLRADSAPSRDAFALSADEARALSGRGAIRYTVATPLPPYAFRLRSDEVGGITVDYMRYLGRRFGVPVQYVPTQGIDEALSSAAAGVVDIVASSSQDLLAPAPLTLVDSFDSSPMVIVIPASAPYVAGLAGLAGKRIAIARDDPMAATVIDRLPPSVHVQARTVHEALDMVRGARADATIGNLTTMDALLRSDYAGELRVAGLANMTANAVLWAAPHTVALLPAMRRALAMMPEIERLRIRNRWNAANYQFHTPWRAIVRRAWPLLLLSVVALAALALNYTRLRREVRLRIHAQTRLKQQLAIKNALLGALPYPVAARDAAQRYMEINAAFEALCGFKRDDIVGRPADPRITGQSVELMETVNELCRRAVATMEPNHAQVEIRDAGGSLRRIIYWANPFRDGDGNAGGVITTMVDITEIYEAQKRARILERRLQDVTSSLPAIVYQIRQPHDGGTPTFTYAAGDTDSSLGITPKELLKSPATLSRFMHPDDLAQVRAALMQPPSSSPIDIEVRLQGRHGLRWASVRSVGRSEDHATLWSGVVADVTDQHQQAAALAKAKDAAEAALRAKESFLAMMSHEIRTPLNGVLGLIEVLLATPLESEQQRVLSLAQESGQALAQILDDVLDYARIEAGRLAILPAPMDLRELSDSVLGLLAPQAHTKDLHLRVHIDADVPATIEADAIRLRQILFNLLGNAIKFTDHGTVTLRIESGHVEDDTAQLVITVTDTGIGISPENLQRLFAPFVQSEHSTTRRYGGTGLGLSICKRLADLMGGELSMRSEPGEGTVVSLRVRCPVVCERYDLPALRHHGALIAVSDHGLAGSLRAHARAAGLRLLSHVPARESAQTYTCFTDGLAAPAGVQPARIIRVTRTPKQLGFRVTAGVIRLSENPLRWAAFLGAAQASLGAQGEPAQCPRPAVGKGRLQPATPDGASHGNRLHILVAEDHPINRELIHQQLALLGYACTLCHDGAEALARLQQGHFDLVLTDCHMPVMDGFDLACAIRASADPRLSRLPIVGVTATTLAEEHQRCFAVGMNECVLKPTTLASIQQALSRALDHPEAVSGTIIASGRREASAAAAPLRFRPALVSREQLRGALGEAPWTDTMLATCVASISADREELAALLQQAATAELRRWCHRAGGAMSVFQHPGIDQLFDRFSAIVKAGDPARTRAAGGTMLDLMDHLLALLRQQE
ncbi:ATP-binding protein [Cupriavidus necator]|uniref:ATP-binding protein n=1 Tax=Cupriavidus necator TaxID=106590 RepID=UPI00339D82FF